MYPEIEPYNTGFLKVDDIHSLYYEESGNQTDYKNAVIFLHGGPGGGISPKDRRYFDPQFYRIILLDQRGAGKSIPPACLVDNNTQSVTEDVEKLRVHLNISSWIVFGGSWGSCLALHYAIIYPIRVKALILRGIFTLRRSELVWLYEKNGAQQLYPDAWEDYVSQIPENERDDIIGAYYKRLIETENKDEQIQYAKSWSAWELSTSRLEQDPEVVKKADKDSWALQFARIECHYFKHNGFLPDNYILNRVHEIRHIPASIIQGRYDIVCPAITSWELHKKWPEAEYKLVSLAGHSSHDLESELVNAADKYKLL